MEVSFFRQTIKRTALLCLAFIICAIKSQTLDSVKLHTLDQDYQNCGLFVSNLTGMQLSLLQFKIVVTCPSMSYIFITTDLINANSTQINATKLIIQGEVTSVRENYETNESLSVTYVMNKNQVYRARINASSIIETELLLNIPLNTLDSVVPVILDLLVSDNFTIVRYDNNTVASYLRNSKTPLQVFLSKLGNINVGTVDDSSIFYFSVMSTSQNQQNTSFQMFASPNSLNSNTLTQYHFFQTFSAQGALLDISVRAIVTVNLGSITLSALSASNMFVVFGCTSCNFYKGRVDIYNRTSLSTGRIGSIDGTIDNQMLGYDIQRVSQFQKSYNQFHIASNNGGAVQNRQNYVNLLRIIRTVNVTNNQTVFAYEFNKQVISGLAPTPQSGLFAEAYGENQLIFKYGFSKVIYGAAICDYQSSYSNVTKKCALCTNSGYSLTSQGPESCLPCGKSQASATTFQQAIYNERCLVTPQPAAVVVVTPPISTTTNTSTTSNTTTQSNSTTNSTKNTTTTNSTSTNSTSQTGNTSTSLNSTVANQTSNATTNTTNNSTNTTTNEETSTPPIETIPINNQSEQEQSSSTNVSTSQHNQTTTLKRESQTLRSKIFIPVIVGVSFVGFIMASIMIWCCIRKRQRTRRELFQAEKIQAESNVKGKVVVTKPETFTDINRPQITQLNTQLGHHTTTEDLRASENVIKIQGHKKVHKFVSDDLDQIDYLEKSDTPLKFTSSLIHDKHTGTSGNQDNRLKDFNTGELQKEIDREVANIRSFFHESEEQFEKPCKSSAKKEQQFEFAPSMMRQSKTAHGAHTKYQDTDVVPSESSQSNQRKKRVPVIKEGRKKIRKGMFNDLDNSSIFMPDDTRRTNNQEQPTVPEVENDDPASEDKENQNPYQDHLPQTDRTSMEDTNRRLFKK